MDAQPKEQILEAALAQTRRHGLATLRMRNLADDLGVTPMALYWHFENKGALIDEIIERVVADAVAELPTTRPTSRNWRRQAEILASVFYEHLADHPGVPDEMLQNQRYPAATIDVIRRGMQIFIAAGLGTDDAAKELLTISFYAIARAQFEAQRRLETRSGETAVERGRARLLEESAGLDPDDPVIAYGVYWLSTGADVVFDHGLGRFLDGIERSLAASEPAD